MARGVSACLRIGEWKRGYPVASGELASEQVYASGADVWRDTRALATHHSSRPGTGTIPERRPAGGKRLLILERVVLFGVNADRLCVRVLGSVVVCR